MSSLPDKMYPIFLLGCVHCLPIFFQCLTKVSQRHEQCIHNAPCALRLHCSLVDYILQCNASHCFALQHATKVSWHGADQVQTRLLLTAASFFDLC